MTLYDPHRKPIPSIEYRTGVRGRALLSCPHDHFVFCILRLEGLQFALVHPPAGAGPPAFQPRTKHGSFFIPMQMW